MAKLFVLNASDGKKDTPTGSDDPRTTRTVKIEVSEHDPETGMGGNRKFEGEIISSIYSSGQIMDTLIEVLEILDIVVKVG